MVNTVHDLFGDLLALVVRNRVNEDMTRWTWAPARFYTSSATSINVAICRALLTYKNDLEVARSDFLDAVEDNIPEHEKDTDRAALRLAWCEKIIAAALAGIPVLREVDDANLLIHIERFKSPSLTPRPYTHLVGVNSIHDLQTLFPTLPSPGSLNPDLVLILERLLMCPRIDCVHAYLPTYVRVGFDIRTGGCFWLDGNEPRPVFAQFNLWSEWAVREESVVVDDGGHVVHEEREPTKAELALEAMHEYGTVTMDDSHVHVERKRDYSVGAGADVDVDASEPSNKRATVADEN